MNYRHAYHAGNFADLVKHGLLLWLLGRMARDERRLLVVDTHAGFGPVRSGRGRRALEGGAGGDRPADERAAACRTSWRS